jgi:hypothetical protein
VGKPRHGKPDRFGEGGGFSIKTEPVDDVELAAAVDGFVEAYVFETKRARVRKDILGRGEKRASALENLPGAIPAAFQTPIIGKAGFPQHVQERFGDLRGVLVTDRDACKATIAGSVFAAMSNGFACVFIAGPLALLLPEVGDSTVVQRPPARK